MLHGFYGKSEIQKLNLEVRNQTHFRHEPDCSAESDFEGQVEEDEAPEKSRAEGQKNGPPDDVVRVLFVLYRAFGRQAVHIVQKELQDQTLKFRQHLKNFFASRRKINMIAYRPKKLQD